jgi:hypothetical protein
VVDGKDDEDDVGVVVRERPEPVKVLLAGRIPEGELDQLAFVLDVGDKVLVAVAAGGVRGGSVQHASGRSSVGTLRTSKTVGT